MTSAQPHDSAIAKYDRRAAANDSLLCVGLDSALEKLPARFQSQAHPQFEFNRWIIERTHSFASAYKPNIAFYEARGDAGLRDLKLTLDFLRENHPDILTVCDAKRGDNANSNTGYVQAVFDWFGFDAVTLQPYMGGAVLQPFLQRAEKGCILLCRTSNPADGEFQDLQVDGKPLWFRVAENARDRWNANGNCMLVVGATVPSALAEVRELVGDMPLLVPGVGAQGGDVAQTIKAGLDSQGRGLIVSASRSVLFAQDPGAAARALRDEINLHRN